MRKCALLLVISLVYFYPVFSQCYFHKIFDHSSYNNDGTVAIETSDGEYVIGGNVLMSNTDVTWLLKLNDCGDTLWTNVYALSPNTGGENLSSIIENSDGTFILSGNHYDHDEGATSSFLAKVSSNGDSLWHFIVDAGYNDWGKCAIPTSDGNFVVGGYFKQQIPNHKLFLLKTDILGNIRWQYDYGSDTSYHYFGSVEKAADQGFLIASREEYFSSTISKSDAWIIKTDSNGIEQWRKSYRGINNEETGIAHAINTHDGGIVLVGAVYDEPTDNYISYCIKTDNNGNVEWHKYYDHNSETDYFTKIRQLDNGDFVVGGTARVINGRPDVRITRLRNNGDHVWTKLFSYYGSNEDDYLEDLIIDSNTDIVATGYVLPPSGVNTGNDMFLLKIDTAGNLLTSISDQALSTNNEQLRIYPNPTEGILNA